jgi:hypothetical protein
MGAGLGAGLRRDYLRVSLRVALPPPGDGWYVNVSVWPVPSRTYW